MPSVFEESVDLWAESHDEGVGLWGSRGWMFGVEERVREEVFVLWRRSEVSRLAYAAGRSEDNKRLLFAKVLWMPG